jgi:hypothetical protein
MLDYVLSDRRLSVQSGASRSGLSRESIRLMRHRIGYHFYDTIPVPPRTREAKLRSVGFCVAQVGRPDFDLCPIVFTDESSRAQDLHLGGFWRRKGKNLEEGTYKRNGHEISVMIWGAVSKDFKTELLRCPERVNGLSCMQMLADGSVFHQYIEKYGNRRFYWQ